MAVAHAIPADEQLISEEEYLRTSYRPDYDYVDGRIEERNFASLSTVVCSLF